AKKGAKAADAVKGGGKNAPGAKPKATKPKPKPKKAADKPTPKKKGGSCKVKAKKNSFVPGTKVLMADGSTKNIEDLKKGEYVLASDPETGNLQARQITDTITGDGVKSLVTLSVGPDGKNGKAKPSKITATANHPFWLPDYGKWAEAGDLEPGMWLQTAAGTWVQITAIDTAHRTQRVHNLTVEGQHTYYVLAGDNPLLVHNDEDACPTGGVNELYGHEGMSKGAFDYRKTIKNFSGGRNVAVAKMNDGSFVGAISKGGPNHSEKLLPDAIKKAGYSKSDVDGIYTERAPCGPWDQNCEAFVATEFPGVPVSYSVPWVNDAQLMKDSNKILNELIGSAMRRSGII
ncbi:polymorphic toxin-type HINT domain-containing protein, partial [Streptomyces fungicidicus]